MVIKRADGKMHFDLTAFINLIPIITTIILSAWVLSAQLKTVEVITSSNSSRIEKLEEFKDQGDRHTAAQGKEQDRRIALLEKAQSEDPPDWYENQVSGYILELKGGIKDLSKDLKQVKNEINSLKTEIKLLEQTVMSKIPNDLIGCKESEVEPGG